jgi:hypothetical protein
MGLCQVVPIQGWRQVYDDNSMTIYKRGVTYHVYGDMNRFYYDFDDYSPEFFENEIVVHEIKKNQLTLTSYLDEKYIVYLLCRQNFLTWHFTKRT